MWKWKLLPIFIGALYPAMVFAQASPMKLSSDQPVEIAADTLEVFQAEKRAVFSGNVIATQGNINMRAAIMNVFYRETGDVPAATLPAEGEASASAPMPAPAPSSDAMGQGIYKIEAEGGVFFATPLETAQGDKGIYNVDTNTIDLLGNVLLTRDKNVLKGTRLTYNLQTGRSILTGGAAAGSSRVRGLFLPNQAKPIEPPKPTPIREPAAGATN
jgi:lipopolysaccharide export system protein LptA